MANGTLSLLMKIGLISEEVISPRNVTGVARLVLSVVAVAFSYFFIHVSFFGPPVAEVFKGAFLLGVIVLSVLMYRNRRKPVREGFIWLDEIFAVVDLVVLCASLALWIYWSMSGRVELWSAFATSQTWAVAGLGAVAGLAIYGYEAIGAKSGDKPTFSDILYLVGSIAAVWWWIDSAVELTERIGGPVPAPVVFFSGILAAASFDIARRIIGPIIPLIGFVFFIYAFEPVAQSMPGLLRHVGFPLDRVMEFLMLSSDGMTGLIVETFAVYIVIFVILGAFLEKTGLGALIIDATFRMTGRFTGGPGLAAVFSSGLFGMISGSPVANVVTTGTFTIPLMKRVGYRPEFAGAVEAAASTGGSYMPPIMGAGAFLLAELTQTSYFEVLKIALIPALLYYLSVALIVYFRAARFNLRGVSVDELPSWERVIPRLHLLLPIPVMVYLLVVGDSPFLAAAKTVVLIVMLRASDLLMEIRTPWSQRSWIYFVPIALLMGVFVYFFGLKIGPPFDWFVANHLGINMGDALFWAVAAFIALKLGEIIAAGEAAGMPIVSHAGLATAAPAGEPPAGAAGCLSRIAVELGKNVWESLEAGAKNTLIIGCIAGVLGILLSSATQSDLPGRVSILLVALSFGLLPLTIFWVIIAGYVIGMGLPITASYVILAIFAVSAMTQLGVPAITAHMISYWLAVVSAVTPPVAVAAYAAAAISQGDPVKTGFQAAKIASMIFIMPIMFVYTPILLNGSTLDVAVTVVGAMFGVIAWAMFLESFWLRATTTVERTLAGAAAVIILLPVDHMINYFLGVEEKLFYETYAVGGILIAAAFAMQLIRRESAVGAVQRPAE
ncbi:MAG: TRAP transporter fused permease subunit [Rhizobiales bacterium]|nr:TRAP transporter fused permease subunit [Hyphomicrobiales bacterium]